MIITNGVVEYGRTIKPADFESKSFRVTLSFGVAEGEDAAAVTAQVGDMATAEVHRRLGLAAQATVQAVEVPASGKRGARRTSPEHDAKVEANEAKREPAPEPDPAAMTEDGQTRVMLEDQKEQEEPPKPISDKDMTEVVTRARARGVASLSIRKAIEGFAPRMSEIAQEKRREFVALVEGLAADEKAAG